MSKEVFKKEYQNISNITSSVDVKPYSFSEIGAIYHADSIQLMASLPPKSIDLIFADPPYNLQLKSELWRPNNTKVSAVDDDWDKYQDFAAYDDFTVKWLTECRRILKDSGAIWVIGSYHNIFRVGKAIQDLQYWIFNDILWVKTNPMPNFKGTRFNNSHETLIWAGKSDKTRPTFNYKTMKAHNEDKQMRSDWHIPICSGSERVKVNGEKAHSTQKPLSLLRRIINATSNPGDIILDPFLGSGTTAVAAIELGRRFIGIEKEQAYVEVATQRTNQISPCDNHLINSHLEIKSPRVAFGTLIDTGYIPIGAELTSSNGHYTATTTAHGTIRSNQIEGSIHKVGAEVQGQPACNGWTFWHFNGAVIDVIRQKFIEENYA